MTLLICVGASVLSSQLILLTEQDRMVEDTKQQLILRSKQHNFDLIRSMNERSDLGMLLAEKFIAEYDASMKNAPEDVPRLHVSDTGNRFGLWNAYDAGYILSDTATLDEAMTTRIEHVASVLDELAPRFPPNFLNFEIEVDGEFYIGSPISRVYARANSPQLSPGQFEASNDKIERYSWGPIRYHPDRSVRVSTLTVPLLREGNVIGRITADSIMEGIISNIRSYSVVGSQSHALLINNQREIVIHPPLMERLESRNPTDIESLSMNMKDESSTATILRAIEEISDATNPS
ncbi:MAG: hypothetical protein VCD00_06270 [Candidatus Hydrogenedentota bacterium]